MSRGWLAADNLAKRYPGGRLALRGVTFRLDPGVSILVGPNGAGKTTLLRVLAGFLAPTFGTVTWCDLPVTANPVAYRDILGYLPQQFRPYPDQTPRQFLAYLGRLKAIPDGLLAARAEEVLALTGLQGSVAGRPCATLSHGEARRLGLAQALLNDPHLLLLDEPTTGLDPEGRVQVLELIQDLGRDKVILFSTHTPADAARFAGHILDLDRGRLIADDDGTTFVTSARGHVWRGPLSGSEVADLREAPGVALVAQVPAGDGRTFRARLVSVDDAALASALPATALRRLERVDPDFEEAYVLRRLKARLGPETWAQARPGRKTEP